MFTLLPNELSDYRATDALRGLRTALLPRISCKESLIPIPGLGSCVPVRSARAGIVAALKALALSPNATVGVPLYCCPVVFKAVKAAGCRPRFIDVDPDTYCISAPDLAAKSSELDVVVAVHMFGNVCDVRRLRQAAPGKPIIEDCAQGLGSQAEGRVVGSFGDLSVFSFRLGKYLSVGEGGAVYCGSPELEHRVKEAVAELAAPRLKDECIHVGATFLRATLRRRPLWGLVGARLWETYSTRVPYTSQSPLVLARIYETDRDLTFRRLPLLYSWIEKQRSNADYYSRNLHLEAGMLCAEPAGAYFNRLQYPLLVSTPEQCDELARLLRQEHISTARPYKDIAAIATGVYGYAGDCPQAERIAGTLLVIPCHHALQDAEIARVANAVNRAWKHLGPGHWKPNPSSTYRSAAPRC